jgi:hypothetical protein
MVEPALEPPQRLGRSHRPIVELEIAIGSPRPTNERIHRDIFKRMKQGKRGDEAADIGSRNGSDDHREPDLAAEAAPTSQSPPEWRAWE